jgi:hypothetical protein
MMGALRAGLSELQVVCESDREASAAREARQSQHLAGVKEELEGRVAGALDEIHPTLNALSESRTYHNSRISKLEGDHEATLARLSYVESMMALLIVPSK